MNLTEIIKEKIVVLDGGMGTMIQNYSLSEADYRGAAFKEVALAQKGNNDLLSITQPQLIEEIHTAYLEAGADLIETNTFNANRISMKDYNMEDAVHQMNTEAVRIAKRAANKITKRNTDKPRFVVGSLGPTNKTTSISPDINDPSFRDVDFDEMADVYQEQAQAMLTAGVDALMVETIFDTLNAKAAFYGIQEAMTLTGIVVPLMASGTITDKSGRTLSGQTTAAFLISLSHINLFSIGLNCALGATDLLPYLKTLSDKAPFAISCHPNAGLPNAFGEYDETPEIMMKNIEPFLEQELVNIIGGCCGTTPDHTRLMAELAANYQPRKAKAAVWV